MHYEEKVVCFVDILGFKAHVDKSIQDEAYIETISTVLNIINDVIDVSVEDAKYRDIDVKVTQFSDSIVISYALESDDQLAFIIMSLGDLLSSLLNYGFLLRGAITQGRIIHTEEQLFGPAINEAYGLESKDACYPRIIIPKKVFNKANFSIPAGDEAKERVREYCFMDDDGWHYIDYIRAERYSSAYNYMLHIKKLCEIIKKNIETFDTNILKKYAWINSKLSHELQWTQNTYTNMCEEEEKLFDELTEKVAKCDIALKYSC